MALDGLTQPARNVEPRSNIAPTTTIDVVPTRPPRTGACADLLEALPIVVEKTLKELPAAFNARAETVAHKPLLRAAFKRTRCRIPASGYTELCESCIVYFLRRHSNGGVYESNHLGYGRARHCPIASDRGQFR